MRFKKNTRKKQRKKAVKIFQSWAFCWILKKIKCFFLLLVFFREGHSDEPPCARFNREEWSDKAKGGRGGVKRRCDLSAGLCCVFSCLRVKCYLERYQSLILKALLVTGITILLVTGIYNVTGNWYWLTTLAVAGIDGVTAHWYLQRYRPRVSVPFDRNQEYYKNS